MMKGMKVLNKASCCPSRATAQKQSIFAPRPFAPKVEDHEAPAAGTGISFSFADISILPRETVQPRLVLGPVGDKYEQEADRVARQVVDTISSSDRDAVQKQEDLEDEEEPEIEDALEGEEELIQGKFASGLTDTLQTKDEASTNETGMPDNLKSGLESLSGMDLSGVRVHYNSPEPAQINALAYTQGQEIHVAPGQEKHLPHEGWHAVQQKQGRVRPTIQMAGVHINDNIGLEKEADIQGNKAQQMYEQVEKPKEDKSRAIDNSVTQNKDRSKQNFTFVHNRPHARSQEMLQLKMLNNCLKGKIVQRAARDLRCEATGIYKNGGKISEFGYNGERQDVEGRINTYGGDASGKVFNGLSSEYAHKTMYECAEPNALANMLENNQRKELPQSITISDAEWQVTRGSHQLGDVEPRCKNCKKWVPNKKVLKWDGTAVAINRSKKRLKKLTKNWRR